MLVYNFYNFLIENYEWIVMKLIKFNSNDKKTIIALASKVNSRILTTTTIIH